MAMENEEENNSLIISPGNKCLRDEPGVIDQTPPSARKTEFDEQPLAEIKVDVAHNLFENYPNEILSHIISFSNPQNPRCSIYLVNKEFYKVMEAEYAVLNQSHRHFPWSNKALTQRSLYFFNTMYRTLLGLYANIQHHMSTMSDRNHFERLCVKIQEVPFFDDKDLPKAYATLLQYHLALTMSRPFQLASFAEVYSSHCTVMKALLIPKLCSIVMQQNPEKYQNETALYFHVITFIATATPEELNTLKSYPSYKQLKSSFMDILNEQLCALKQTPELLSSREEFAAVWKQILTLEPEPTCWQLQTASIYYFKEGDFTNAVKYYEKRFERLAAARQTPTPGDYHDMALSYRKAGNFTNAVKYYEKKLERLAAEGQTPTSGDYYTIAFSYLKAGDFTNAVKYYEKNLERLVAEGQPPTQGDYHDIACSFFKEGDFTNAVKYFEKKLELLAAEGQIPTLSDYHNIASSFFKTGDFTNAVKYYEKKLERLAAEGQTPTSGDYYTIAFSYLKAGDFTNAVKYYEKKLERLAAEGRIPSLTDYEYIAFSYLRAGNFANAVKHYEKKFERLAAEGQIPSLTDYEYIAFSYLRAGDFANAVKYYEKKFERLAVEGQTPSLGDYFGITFSYVRLGNADQQVVYYGELWHDQKENTVYTEFDKKLCRRIQEAYIRLGNHERAAFFGDFLNSIDQLTLRITR